VYKSSLSVQAIGAATDGSPRLTPSIEGAMMSRLKNKVAVITGGASGMGLATAKRFVEEGAFVYITGRRQIELDKAVSLIGRSVAAVQGDVSNLADLDRLFAKVASEKGKIDILFAGAGIVDPQLLAETTEESFDRVFAINTRGLAFTVKKALPLLNDGGAIIVITSIAENKGIPGFTAYSATKAAVRSFVRTWTVELKDRRIRVNAISPGPIDTPIFDQQASTKEGADQARSQFAAAVPFGRLGRPEEIASTALFLASDEASFIAGVDLPVDGGMTAI
jgi:NAD(P)-dependent dehydrogenase (short-subunit alcohol dehydrogenase family)